MRKPMGGLATNGYWRINIGYDRYLAHRLAWFYVHGIWPCKDIDHINGDRCDNRISNLRLADKWQNNGNSEAYCTSSTGLKGIYWDRQLGRYSARIMVNGKRKYWGAFDTPELAHEAYREADIALRGEFARTA